MLCAAGTQSNPRFRRNTEFQTAHTIIDFDVNTDVSNAIRSGEHTARELGMGLRTAPEAAICFIFLPSPSEIPHHVNI